MLTALIVTMFYGGHMVAKTITIFDSQVHCEVARQSMEVEALVGPELTYKKVCIVVPQA